MRLPLYKTAAVLQFDCGSAATCTRAGRPAHPVLQEVLGKVPVLSHHPKTLEKKIKCA